ncbi:MAG: hypothetical protein QXL94_00975 [Candidatus Parvarchaeum sp.]
MTKKQDKDSIMYEITIDSSQTPRNPNKKIEFIEEAWKYQLYISGTGKYEDAYIGNNIEDMVFFADTKEGILRDLGAFLTNQVESPNERKWLGLEIPEPMNLNNVKINDNTGMFSLNEIRDVFNNPAKYADTPIPAGEQPFLITIRDDGDGKYEVFTRDMDYCVYEEIANPYNYDVGDIVGNLDAKEVNDEIRKSLDKYNKDDIYIEKPNIENTKIINYTDNPEFTPSRIFGTSLPIKVMNVKPSLQLMTKSPIQNTNIIEKVKIPIEHIRMPNIEKELQTKEKEHIESEDQKKRLKA